MARANKPIQQREEHAEAAGRQLREYPHGL
jgi:hypothetical protein